MNTTKPSSRRINLNIFEAMCVSCNKFAILISTDPPLVSLRLGSTLIVDDIKEGDDLYMECQIQANPKFSKMYWMHDVSLW